MEIDVYNMILICKKSNCYFVYDDIKCNKLILHKKVK